MRKKNYEQEKKNKQEEYIIKWQYMKKKKDSLS